MVRSAINAKLHNSLKTVEQTKAELFLATLNCNDKVLIHCAGKVGEILAATSIAKFIKIHYPHKHITWNCSKQYNHVLALCPYVDEVVNYDKNIDVPVKELLEFAYKCVVNMNKSGVSYWVQAGALNINAYYNYMVDSSGKYIQKPFNEQMFNSMCQPYNVRYHPDIIYYPEYEQKAKEIANNLGRFIIILPFGNSVLKPLSIMDNIENLSIILKSHGVNILTTGNTILGDSFNFNLCYNYPDLELGVLFSLFRRSLCTIGINSGILFSSLFLRCPNVIMEDKNQVYGWDIRNVVVDFESKVLSKETITVDDILGFLTSVGVI